jgi:hypothetical protein
VYSFGVLALEVLKGKHPGDYIADLALMSTENVPLMRDLLDDRPDYPDPEVENVLVSIMQVSRGCLNANPQSRPTMNMVSNLFIN